MSVAALLSLSFLASALAQELPGQCWCLCEEKDEIEEGRQIPALCSECSSACAAMCAPSEKWRRTCSTSFACNSILSQTRVDSCERDAVECKGIGGEDSCGCLAKVVACASKNDCQITPDLISRCNKACGGGANGAPECTLPATNEVRCGNLKECRAAHEACTRNADGQQEAHCRCFAGFVKCRKPCGLVDFDINSCLIACESTLSVCFDAAAVRGIAAFAVVTAFLQLL
jgi:hypothetical protein